MSRWWYKERRVRVCRGHGSRGAAAGGTAAGGNTSIKARR